MKRKIGMNIPLGVRRFHLHTFKGATNLLQLLVRASKRCQTSRTRLNQNAKLK